jgi:hypothetical protein
MTSSGCETISEKKESRERITGAPAHRRERRERRFTEAPIIGILKRVEKGHPLAGVCREEGISDATYSRWKAQYGGLEVSQVRR